MQDLRLIFRYGRPYHRDLIAAVALIVVECGFEMVIPTLMATLIDEGVPAQDLAVILRQGGLMALCAVLALVTGLLYARFAARYANGFAAELRRAEYAAVEKFDFANLDRFSERVAGHPHDHRRHRAAQRRQHRPAAAGAQPGHALPGPVHGLCAQPAAHGGLPGGGPHPGPDAGLDRQPGGAAVRPPAAGRGPPERPHPGSPHRHPRHQGLRARRVGKRTVRRRQRRTLRRQHRDLPPCGAQHPAPSRRSCTRPSSASCGSAAPSS